MEMQCQLVFLFRALFFHTNRQLWSFQSKAISWNRSYPFHDFTWQPMLCLNADGHSMAETKYYLKIQSSSLSRDAETMHYNYLKESGGFLNKKILLILVFPMLSLHCAIRTQWMGCSRFASGARIFFFPAAQTEERVLFLRREEKGLHGRLHCCSSAQKNEPIKLSRVR